MYPTPYSARLCLGYKPVARRANFRFSIIIALMSCGIEFMIKLLLSFFYVYGSTTTYFHFGAPEGQLLGDERTSKFRRYCSRNLGNGGKIMREQILKKKEFWDPHSINKLAFRNAKIWLNEEHCNGNFLTIVNTWSYLDTFRIIVRFGQ